MQAELTDLHRQVESLSSTEGEYILHCSRTGERPVPVENARFPDRARARAAAVITQRYRATLRSYDPDLPFHDIIVSYRTVDQLERTQRVLVE